MRKLVSLDHFFLHVHEKNDHHACIYAPAAIRQWLNILLDTKRCHDESEKIPSYLITHCTSWIVPHASLSFPSPHSIHFRCSAHKCHRVCKPHERRLTTWHLPTCLSKPGRAQKACAKHICTLVPVVAVLRLVVPRSLRVPHALNASISGDATMSFCWWLK